MKLAQTTKFVCILTMLALGVYDLIAVSFGGEEVSVSRWVSDTGLNHPYPMMVVGFLLGHWFAVEKVSDMVRKQKK